MRNPPSFLLTFRGSSCPMNDEREPQHERLENLKIWKICHNFHASDKKEKSQREFCGKRQKTDNLVVYEELEHGNKIPDGYKMCLNNSH